MRDDDDDPGALRRADRPEPIAVSVSRVRELTATHADLFVTIQGEAFFTGKAALTKAREVAQLVNELVALGVKEGDIRLQGVTAYNKAGLLTRASRAAYALRVTCADLDRLADVLAAVGGQKNAELRGLVWRYPDDPAADDDALTDLIRQANARAQRIANALGVKLLDVRSFFDDVSDPEGARVDHFSDSLRARHTIDKTLDRSMGIDAPGLSGVEISHTKRVTYTVKVEYRISEFGAGGGGAEMGG